MNTKTAKYMFGAVFTILVAATSGCDDTAEDDLQQVEEDQLMEDRLKTFDELDFDVFTHQKWDRLGESHSKDIVVHWPDDRVTNGIDAHIDDLKFMFVYAPDTRIEKHPIKIASDGWTSVVGIIEGTFSRPMPRPDGTSIPPTNKAFKVTMTTVGHWGADGRMDEEYLFFDNLAMMRQIGLAE